MAFTYVAFKFGRDEFFSLTRRHIRFNRKEQKIYTIRRRRFFAKPGQGDITWEVPWDDNAIFCIHKGVGSFGNPYHTRCYMVDDAGNVVRAFAIGREWEGAANLEGLLSQWNYWCWDMNHGPPDLPQPTLYFKEKEDIYPFDPKRKTHGWMGEPDGARNAELWAQDIPPQIPPQNLQEAAS